ncbi:uncharacterized protein LOC111619553 [Centruroides sculpturatus]|uniref:uncharacterized protein LOC111619553 n=1 Tax=Centruroides sculpturatus TaxID=218467 RepID=UPI000C6E4778|nr:uncharacterized protein LOC111619553 [Centruroides sculpturatus]
MAEETRLNFLDLSRIKIKSVHQLESALLKVADLKLRSEKPKEEDVLINARSSKRHSTSPEFPFLDPIPASMRQVNIQEMCQVDIEWKMLTLCRPASKFEEDIFTRYVELAKLARKVRKSYGQVPTRSTPWNVRSYAKARVPDDWGEENLGDNAHEFCYDYFTRQAVAEDEEGAEENQSLDQQAEETGVKRRTPLRKTTGGRKSESLSRKTNRLAVPEVSKTPSPCSTPETKARGQKSRSITPVSRGADKSVKKKHRNSVKKKATKKKSSEDVRKPDSS